MAKRRPVHAPPRLEVNVSAEEAKVYVRIAAIVVILLTVLLIAYLAEPYLSNPNLSASKTLTVALVYLIPVAMLAGSAVSMLHPNPKFRALGAAIGLGAAAVFVFADSALLGVSPLAVFGADPYNGAAVVGAIGGSGLGLYSAGSALST